MSGLLIKRRLIRLGIPRNRAEAMVDRAISKLRVHRRFYGMGDLFGPGQEYYSHLSNAQHRAVAIQSEIAAIGKDAWNGVQQQHPTDFTSQGWSPISDYDYDHMMSFWLAQAKRLITTASKIPSQADINDVIYLSGGTQKMINIVKGYLPDEVVGQVEAERAETEEKLGQMKLKSPADAAMNTFMDDIKGKFAIGGIGIAIAGTVAAGIAAALLLKGR